MKTHHFEARKSKGKKKALLVPDHQDLDQAFADTNDGDAADSENSIYSQFEDGPNSGEESGDSLPENVVASYEKYMAHEVRLFILGPRHIN
jgi:hypothetical protein